MSILLCSLGYWVLSNCSCCFLCQSTFSTPTGQIIINYYYFLIFYFEIVLHVKIHDAIDHEKYQLKIDHKGNFSTLVQNWFIRLKPNTLVNFILRSTFSAYAVLLQAFLTFLAYAVFLCCFQEFYKFSCCYFEKMMCFSGKLLFKIL